jgi:hypothetical protein
MGKLAGHKISAECSVDRFCRNILCGGRQVFSFRTGNEFWVLYRSYGAIEGCYPAERAEKWRKDSILHADILPCHMSPSPQLFLMETFSGLFFFSELSCRADVFGGESFSAALFGEESCRADVCG